MNQKERFSKNIYSRFQAFFSRLCLLLLVALAGPFGAHAQGDRDWNPKALPGEGVPMETVKEPSAWTLTYPLGFHIPAEVDTAQYNYQRRSIPTMASDAWATTGNLGAPGMNLL